MITARASIDPLHSPLLQRELPGLETALDEATMRGRLQTLLFGDDSPYQIERCNPGQAIYLGGDFCGLRYELELRGQAEDDLIEPLIIGRVFQEPGECLRFMRERLDPVVALARGRADLAPFARLAAPIEELNMVVHAFPIDADLPQLLDVTDPRRVAGLLRPALGADFKPHQCRVQLAHYGRQHRCTLRYILTGSDAAGVPLQKTVYGKLTADGSGARTVPVIAALHDSLQAGAIHVNIPHVLDYQPERQLLLLDAIPGKPQVARLLKARLAEKVEAPAGALTLETAMWSCGQIAAAMHRSGITIGRHRILYDELGWLKRNIDALSRISPALGSQLLEWLQQTATVAQRSDPLPLCFSHGDFTYTQIIFEGANIGLVDFDTVCQAEPALDLGQFLAYQRLVIRKDQRPETPLASEAVEQLCAGFLDSYMQAIDKQVGDRQPFYLRVQIYEILMLLRLVIHSWQKLKVDRLGHAMDLIEERIVCLP